MFNALIDNLTIREKIELLSELGQSICNEGISKEVLKDLIDRECIQTKVSHGRESNTN